MAEKNKGRNKIYRFKQSESKMLKVMVFGAFDGLHPGHLDFFRQAKKYGNILIVSVALDENVKKIKGESPLFGQDERLDLVRNCRLVDKAILGDRKKRDFFNHIKKEAPDAICLGYDQWASREYVLRELKKVGLDKTLVVRLSAWRPLVARSRNIKKRLMEGRSAIL